MSDLNYINNMHKKRNAICERLENDLTSLAHTQPKSDGLLHFIEFKDLKTWSVEDIMRDQYGSSENLRKLGEKLSRMIKRGDSINVDPMLKRIVNNGQKRIIKRNRIDSATKTTSLGRGHFRTHQGEVIILNENEINAIKKYFKI